MADKLNTRLQTPIFRASYAYVWEPVADKKGTLKYRILMMFPKTTDLTPLAEAAMNAAINKWGKERAQDLFANRAETGFKWPLRDGDVKAKAKPDKYGILAGMNFCNASSKEAPGIVQLEGNRVTRIVNPRDFYSGCWAVATVNFFPFEVDGGIGVGVGLNNLCKMKDDERLAGIPDAEDEFAEFAAQQAPDAGVSGTSPSYLD